MVVSNMTKNLTNTVKSRPPLVVFTVCLMGIVITTFSLAYYIHNYEKPLLNIDAKDDWISILKHLNLYDMCVEDINSHPFQKINQDKYDNIVSTTTVARIPSKLHFDQETSVEGLAPLAGWSSKCPERANAPTYLHVAFTLPKKDANTTNEYENICVMLTGPANFLPKLVEQSCNVPVKEDAKKLAKFDKVNDIGQEKFCAGGSIGKLEFDIGFSRNLKWDLYLSAEDRVLIGYHLIVISSILLVVCILITCYALIKTKASNISSGDTKQSLISKGMYL